MTSLKTANRRVGSLFAVAALVLATITPGLVPAFASAAQLSERSVELSSSSKGTDDVNYNVKFNTAAYATTGAVVLEFCSDSPLIGAACGVPAGFSVAGGTATGFTPSALTTPRNNARVFAPTVALTAAAVTIPVLHVNNPDASGPLYVRISTFDTEANAQAYTTATAATATGAIDQGSAAVSITDSVGVSGAVLETMTFCVSGAEILSTDCTGTTAPTVKLGNVVGTSTVLDTQDVYEGSIYSQISTNAASGAVVNLKSSATGCGGLLRAGAPSECDIKPSTTDITQGTAFFGIKVIGATANPSGAFGIASGAIYDASTFKINFDEDDEATGVTSPYGDPVLDTNNAPANAKNAQLTFGASVANNTPAGLYSADFSLIATGKF